MKPRYLISIILILIFRTTSAVEIDTTVTVQIGGINQILSVQGEDVKNPLILYLHGGPGQAASPQREKITSKLEKDFVIVHWDQRNSGKTLEVNTSEVPVTIDLMQSDAEEVLNYLLKEYQQEKLTIVAHSWGNVLGFHLVEKYPERIEALFSVSPGIDATKSQKIALKRLKDHFSKENNGKALGQLSSIKVPHESIEDMVIQYRWQSVYDGEQVTDEMIEQYMPFFLDWEKKWMPIYKELYDRNLSKDLKEIACPIYFFVGKQDYTTNFKLTEAYYKKLKAPSKKLIWFDTGHNIPALEPDVFQSMIMGNL